MLIAVPTSNAVLPSAQINTGLRRDGILQVVDAFRSAVSPQLDTEKRQQLGQFLTPGPVAEYMASLFNRRYAEIRLLDAGAGAGILSAAFVQRQIAGHPKPRRIDVTAYEIDQALLPYLRKTYERCADECQVAGIEFSVEIRHEDFIEAASRHVLSDLFFKDISSYNAAIVNPPYGKITNDSRTRLLLRSAGIETGNLYTGFVALIVKLLARNGELVAITPRSFCNGPYFRPFREMFLKEMSLRRVHVYESRTSAFRDDDVLQENVIVHAVKSGIEPKIMRISSSSGELGAKVVVRKQPYENVVSPTDPLLFIRLPTCKEHAQARHEMARFGTPLDQLGVTVSTGRVIDFRAREVIRPEPVPGTCPLIYPCHFNGLFVLWPKEKGRKPNAIVDDTQTQDFLLPEGIYVLVKRFTTKEERRRVVACVYDPARIPGARVGFENHLNYFHANGGGLSMAFAKGLWAFLNSTFVDLYLRQFNGHTQVNATDLRSLSYPARVQVEALGSLIPDNGLNQDCLDELIKKELA